jgi:hypothetical protein
MCEAWDLFPNLREKEGNERKKEGRKEEKGRKGKERKEDINQEIKKLLRILFFFCLFL